MAFKRLVERLKNSEKNHVLISFFLKISTCAKKTMLFEENEKKWVHKTKNINNV